MAEMVEQAGQPAAVASPSQIVFTGVTRNMVMGIAMMAAGVAAFFGGLTHTFFAEAMAWTFIIWGAFFLYGDLLESTRRFVLDDEGLTIEIPMRPWGRTRTWAWKDVFRMDVVVHRNDMSSEQAVLQVYHQYPGEVTIEREDRSFDPELARLIIERAKLKGDPSGAPNLTQLPTGRDVTFTWKR